MIFSLETMYANTYSFQARHVGKLHANKGRRHVRGDVAVMALPPCKAAASFMAPSDSGDIIRVPSNVSGHSNVQISSRSLFRQRCSIWQEFLLAVGWPNVECTLEDDSLPPVVQKLAMFTDAPLEPEKAESTKTWWSRVWRYQGFNG